MEDDGLATPLLQTEPIDGGNRDPENPSPTDGEKEAGDAPPASDDYESHFTLRIPTSTVHFRGSTIRVIDTDHDQIILQQRTIDDDGGGGGKNDGRVLVKRLSPGTYAQRALRTGYTLITILFLGFLFVFCAQVLLFLFIALPVEGGYTSTSTKVDTLHVISTLLSLPVMFYGLPSIMTMGSAFVADTYKGAALFRSTVVEILYMCVFLIVPALTFAFNLMARSDEPWRNAARVWAFAVLVTFMVWGLAVTYVEVNTCFRLVEKHFCSNNEDESTLDDSSAGETGADRPTEGQDSRLMKEAKRLLHIANRALIITQKARYGGEKMERFDFAGTDVSSSLDREPTETNMSLFSRFTALSFCSFIYNSLDTPKRVYSSEEVRPFMTKNNWSMHKMWCSGDSRKNNVIVARGPSALTEDQIRYSVLCTVTSSVVATLLLLGAITWMEMGVQSYIIVGAIAVVCCIGPIVGNGVEMYRMYEGVNSEEALLDQEADGVNLFQIWHTVRITEPQTWYCYFRVAVEVFFFFFWPFISQVTNRNYPVAVIFFLLGSFSFLWRFFDTSKVISEIGSMSDAADGTVNHQEEYCLNEVVTRIISNKGRAIWSWVFIVFFIGIFLLFMGSQQESDTVLPTEVGRGARPGILLLNDFYYPPQPDTIAYPTCGLSKGFQFPGHGSNDLGDYGFLSAISYETLAINDYLLPKWFGPDAIVDEEEFVSQYRQDSGTASSPVYFKLFSITSAPGYSVMSIRGSETSLDWLVDMQIWSAAGLGQVVKWLTPMGWIWSPIIPDLVTLVNKIESKAISEASYYKVTSQFVNDVLAGYADDSGKQFSNVQVTGTSLGGGLAIITGAQTNAFAVAFSGIGATLSRDSFDPPIKLEKLNAQTFNWIPERDYVAMVGGSAPLFQNAQCTAPKNDLWSCHSIWRSICEINYKCGSNSRPVLCRCVTEMGYPMPVQNGTRTFEEACKEENTTWYEMFPPIDDPQ